MKEINDVFIIGIDSGYGNIKTANCCFPASVAVYDTEPVFKDNLLVYDGRYYLIGEGHKEFLADKTKDIDYYVLALAGIARELNIRKITSGKVHIAAGLPLTWVSGQRNEFKDYLMQNREVEFTFRGTQYHVEIIGADVFPQGFAAVADRLSEFKGVNMLCDIGNGTMNIMFINDKKPIPGNMFTEKYGTHQCLLAVRENVMRIHHATVDEAIINRVFRFGTADIKEDYLKTITDTATEYPTAITQNVEYLLDSVQASTMLSNSEFVIMLNQAASDREKLAQLLNISNEQMSYITNADAGCGLIKYGSALVPFINQFPRDTKLYQLMTTRPGEGEFARGQD